MTTKNSEKFRTIYKCEYCDYITSDASNFSKHLKTPKHQMKQMKTMVVLKEKNKVFQCKYCNKILKSRTTLWRHEKRCNGCEESDMNVGKCFDKVVFPCNRGFWRHKINFVENNDHWFGLHTLD